MLSVPTARQVSRTPETAQGKRFRGNVGGIQLKVIYTVGHSNHPIEKFIGLLSANGITAIADVRSQPHSRRNPQFNKERLAAELAQHGIAYVFLGKELGARSDDPACYEQGRVQYTLLAAAPVFKAGIDRVLLGAQKYRLALMCAEKEPLDCHRTLLVSRALDRLDVSIVHILADASVEPQEKTMARLVDLVGLSKDDMFHERADLVAHACKLREQRIAYVKG